MAIHTRRWIVALLWEFCLLLTAVSKIHNAGDYIQGTLLLNPHPVKITQENEHTEDLNERVKRQAVDDDPTNIPGVIASTFTNEIVTKINGKDQVITETRIHYFFPEQVFTGEVENPIKIEGAQTESAVSTYTKVEDGQTKFITSTFYTYFNAKGGNQKETAATETMPGILTSSAISTYNRRRGRSTIQVTSTFYTYYFTQGNGMGTGGNSFGTGEASESQLGSGENAKVAIPGAITSTFISSFSTVIGDITKFITETRLKFYLPETIEDEATEKMDINGAITSSIISTYTKVSGSRTRLFRSTFFTYYQTKAVIDNEYDYDYEEGSNSGQSASGGAISGGSMSGGSASGGAISGGSMTGGSASGGAISGGSMTGESASNEGEEGNASGEGGRGHHGIRHKVSGGSNQSGGSSSENELDVNDDRMITSTILSTVTRLVGGKKRTIVQTKFLYYPEEETLVESVDDGSDSGVAFTSSVISSFTQVVNGKTRKLRSTYYTYYFTNDGSEEGEEGNNREPIIKPSKTKAEFPGAITSTIFTTYSTIIGGKTRMVTETRLKFFIPDETVINVEKETKNRQNLITSTFFSTFTVTKNNRRSKVTSTVFEFYKQGGELEKVEEMEIEPTRSNEILASENMEGFLTSTFLSTFTTKVRGRSRTLTKTKLVYYPITETVTEKVNKPMTIPGAISSSQISMFTNVENGKTRIIRSTFYTYFFNEATQVELKPSTEVELDNKITSTFYQTFTKRLRGGKSRLITSTFYSTYNDYDDDNDYEYEDSLITSTFYKTLIRRRGGKTRTIVSTITSSYAEEIQPSTTIINDRFITSTAISKYTEIVSGHPTILTSKVLTFYDEEGNEIEDESEEGSSQKKRSRIVKPTTKFNVEVVTKAIGGEEIILESSTPTRVVAHKIRTPVPTNSKPLMEMEFPEEMDVTSSANIEELPLLTTSVTPEELIISETTKIITAPITSEPTFFASSQPMEENTEVLETITSTPVIEVPSMKTSTVYSTVTRVKGGSLVVSTITKTKYFPVTILFDKTTSEVMPKIKPSVILPAYGNNQNDDSSEQLTSTIYSTYETVIDGATSYLTKTYIRHYIKKTQSANEAENEENPDDQNEEEYSESHKEEEYSDDQNEEENNNVQHDSYGKRKIVTSTFLKTFKTRYGGGKDRMITSTVISTYELPSEEEYSEYYEDLSQGETHITQDAETNDYSENESNKKDQSGGKYNKNPPTKEGKDNLNNDDYESIPQAITSTFYKTYIKRKNMKTHFLTSTLISVYSGGETNIVKKDNKEGQSNDYDYYEEDTQITNPKQDYKTNENSPSQMHNQNEMEEKYNNEGGKVTSTFLKTFTKVYGRRTYFLTSTITSAYSQQDVENINPITIKTNQHTGQNSALDKPDYYYYDDNTKEQDFTKTITSTIAKTYHGKTRYLTSTFTSVYPILVHDKDEADDSHSESTELDLLGTNNNFITTTFTQTFKKVRNGVINYITSTITVSNRIKNHKEDDGKQLTNSDYKEQKIASTFLQTIPKVISGKTRYFVRTITSYFSIHPEETNLNNENSEETEEKSLKKDMAVTSTFYSTYAKVIAGRTRYFTETKYSYYPLNNQIGNGEIKTDEITSTLTQVFPLIKGEKTRYLTRTVLSFYPQNTKMLRIKPTEKIKRKTITSTFYSIYPTVVKDSTQFQRQTELIYYPINGDPFTRTVGKDDENEELFVDAVISKVVKTYTHIEPGATNYITSSWVSEYPSQIISDPSFGIEMYNKPGKKQIKSTFVKFYTQPVEYKNDEDFDGPVTTIYGIPGAITSTFYRTFTTVKNGFTRVRTETRILYYPTEESFNNAIKKTVASTIVSTYNVDIPDITKHITSTLVNPNEIKNTDNYEEIWTFYTTYTNVKGHQTLFSTRTRYETHTLS